MQREKATQQFACVSSLIPFFKALLIAEHLHLGNLYEASSRIYAKDYCPLPMTMRSPTLSGIATTGKIPCPF
jgi:hypothetical protein